MRDSGRLKVLIKLSSFGWALLLASGCAGASQTGPEATLYAYTDAVARGDATAAYALLAPRTQTDVEEAEFLSQFEENRQEIEQQATAMVTELDRRPTVAQAEVSLESGEYARLKLEEGRWRLDGRLLGSPALVTPEDAVTALRHALQRRELDALLRVLARSTRVEMETMMRAFLEGSDDPLSTDVRIEGNDATVRTNGHLVRLTLESGQWHIVDIEPL